jgi:hypothetical protein
VRRGAGYTPTELNSEAVVTLEEDKEGFRISRLALTLRASVPDETVSEREVQYPRSVEAARSAGVHGVSRQHAA